MKLEILQDQLSKALNLASKFVSPKAQLPVLGNILLLAKKNKLSILATNLETSIALNIGAKIIKDGEIAIPAKTISEIISNLALKPILLEAKKEQLHISSNGFSSNVLGINTSDFPSIPQSISKVLIELSSKKFVEALSKVVFAASSDETRPVLTGVLFIFEGNSLSLVATDGYRLSQKKIKLDKKLEKQTVVLPKPFIVELIRILGNEDKKITIQVQNVDNQVVFSFANVVLTSRVIEGEFPDFEKIIPKSSQIKISLDKLDFERAIKLSAVFARESANIVKFQIKKDSLNISAESQKSGGQEMNLDAKVDGEELEISYNYRFIEEFLDAVNSEDVELKFINTTSPGIFVDTDDSEFLHLIMPVRVTE